MLVLFLGVTWKVAPLNWMKWLLSNTWREFDLDTAYVIYISISLGFLYMAMLQMFKRKCYLSRHGVAMGCYGCCILPGAAIVTSQCYGHCCFTKYALTWAEQQSTPWQRKLTSIMGALSINWFCRTSMRFFCIFLLNNSIYMIGRNCGVGTVIRVFNKCSGLLPSVTLSGWWHSWCAMHAE